MDYLLLQNLVYNPSKKICTVSAFTLVAVVASLVDAHVALTLGAIRGSSRETIAIEAFLKE